MVWKAYNAYIKEMRTDIFPRKPASNLAGITFKAGRKSRDDTAYDPKDLFMQLAKKWKQLKTMQEQDSQELLRYFLDALKDEDAGKSKDNIHIVDEIFGGQLLNVIVCDTCKAVSTATEPFLDISLPIVSSSSRRNNLASSRVGSSTTLASPQEPTTDTPAGDCALPPYFNLRQVSQMSDTELAEALTRDFAREVRSSQAPATLRASLEQFTSVEVLDGDNKFACANCLRQRKLARDAAAANQVDAVGAQLESLALNDTSAFSKAYKRYLVKDAPRILVCHLKRFSQHFAGRSGSRRFDKLNDHVQFPEYFTLDDYLLSPLALHRIQELEKLDSDTANATDVECTPLGTTTDASTSRQITAMSRKNLRRLRSVKPESAKGTVYHRPSLELALYDDSSAKYRLYGVVCHGGTMNSGHYTNYILSDLAIPANGDEDDPQQQVQHDTDGSDTDAGNISSDADGIASSLTNDSTCTPINSNTGASSPERPFGMTQTRPATICRYPYRTLKRPMCLLPSLPVQ